MVRTYRNTDFTTWWKLATLEFEKRGLAAPDSGEAYDAYELGESPETWAEFEANY